MEKFGVIYLITNLQDGMRYVGQTTQGIATRWRGHVSHSKQHENIYLGNAILKYGKDAFSIEELSIATSREELDKLEQHFIVSLNTLRPNGYNLSEGGLGGIAPSAEVIDKLRNSKLGSLNPNYGRKYSERERRQLSEKLSGEKNPFFGKKHTEETRKRLSAIAKNRGPSPLKGRKASEEAKAKMRLAWKLRDRTSKLKGIKRTEEVKAKLREAVKASYIAGRKGSMTGRKHTEEAKLRMSAARRNNRNGDNQPITDNPE